MHPNPSWACSPSRNTVVQESIETTPALVVTFSLYLSLLLCKFCHIFSITIIPKLHIWPWTNYHYVLSDNPNHNFPWVFFLNFFMFHAPNSMSSMTFTCFYCGKPGHFQRNCRQLKQDKGIDDDVELRKFSNDKNTSAIATNEEELLFFCEQDRVNLANVECSWVVNSGASFHLTPKRECFSSYIVGDYGYVRMGNYDTNARLWV